MRHFAGVVVWLLPSLLVGAPVDFGRDVAPIFRKHCLGCHGAAQQMSGLRLDRAADVGRGGYSGPVVVPGDASASKLYQLVSPGGIRTAAGKSLRMPPAGPQLTAAQVALVREWIDRGAAMPESPGSSAAARSSARDHWSFQPLRRPAVPVLAGKPNPRHPIDAFIQATLDRKRIKPSPEASRETLVRRVYLDLIGLLPTPRETREFLEDSRPDAYERLVDRLLESPHYGEKWARLWLDLVRYADSEGGIQDYPRLFAWRYRDWVIRALNEDMPFDRFTIEQVAGDLLPEATADQKIGAGFNRHTITSREGGVDLEKLRFDQVVDRASTIGTVWLGLTVGCAQCHDHKYDPLTQRDFYRLFAYYHNTQEVDEVAPLAGEIGSYRRYVGDYRRERQKLLEQYKVAPLQREWEAEMLDTAANPGKRPAWDVAYGILVRMLDHGERILGKPPGTRTRREAEALTDHFVRYYGSAVGGKRYDELKYKELDKALTALAVKYPPLSLAMTVEEDLQPEPAHVHLRGDYRERGVEVTPGTPEFLPAPPANAPPNRLTLARWLVARSNPLTARVAVNRAWQELFGRGLVRTSEDLGLQGEKPSHPELLDWLACELMAKGWRVKSLHRLIVLSAAYRRSSEARPDLRAIDPDNRWLARQNRIRLPAELIRDAALQAGGLLWDEVGGESVRPPQPEGVADLSYSLKWEESTGRARYRRGLYVFVQRTATYPLMMNFDAPDRTVSCSRRETSNTPLQALNLMNDPVFAEMAEGLAARLLAGQKTERERVDHAFQICFSRRPGPAERDAVLSHLGRRRALAREEGGEILHARDLENVDPAEAAAWFGVSRALLNTDEFMTRE